MASPRQANKYEYHLPNEQMFVGKGGASNLVVYVISADDAALTASVSGFKWRDYSYPLVVLSDTFTYQSGTPSGKTLNLYGGASQYTRQSLGAALYGSGGPLWTIAGAAIHDQNTWSAEWSMQTGADVNTTQYLWWSWDGVGGDGLFARLQGGQLNIINNVGVITISGPTTIAANTFYHCVMTNSAGTPAIWLNGVAQVATGGPLNAFALGSGFYIALGTAYNGTSPFLGSVGSFFFTRSSALTAAKIGRHYGALTNAFSTFTLAQATVAAGTEQTFTLGKGQSVPLPNTVYISTTGHAYILTELTE